MIVWNMSSDWTSVTTGKPMRMTAAMPPSSQAWSARKVGVRRTPPARSTSTPVKEKKVSSMIEMSGVSPDISASHGIIGRE